jgi:hypothetical protein
MTKRNATVLCICIIAVGIGGWIFVRSREVSWALAEKVLGGPGTTIDFAEIAPFAWDRVYFFRHYTSHQSINDSLGFDWPDVSNTTIDLCKGTSLVVFVKGGEVEHWFEHPRNHGELLDLANGSGYSRDEARFVVGVMAGTKDRMTVCKLPP